MTVGLVQSEFVGPLCERIARLVAVRRSSGEQRAGRDGHCGHRRPGGEANSWE